MLGQQIFGERINQKLERTKSWSCWNNALVTGPFQRVGALLLGCGFHLLRGYCSSALCNSLPEQRKDFCP